METFKANNTYTGRFITDADSTFEHTVVKRTAKTITLANGKRCKIHNDGETEFAYPNGQYSMAPVIRASRLKEAA